MARIIADRVFETSTTTGTGALTLAGAEEKFRSFSSVLSDADTTVVSIVNQDAAEWEVSVVTYNSTGDTLTRSTVLSSSNSGSAVNFSAGTKDIQIVPSADDVATLSISANFTAGLQKSGADVATETYADGAVTTHAASISNHGDVDTTGASEDDVLQLNASGDWVAAAISTGDPTWDLLAETTLASAASTIDFTGLSTDYQVFRVNAVLSSDAAARTPRLTFNGDSGGNYDYTDTTLTAGDNSFTHGTGLGDDDFIQLMTASLHVDNLAYCQFVVSKTVAGEMAVMAGVGQGLTSTDNARHHLLSGRWSNQTELIDQITLSINSDNFAAGSHVQVFGRVEP